MYNLITYHDIVNSQGRTGEPVTVESDVMSQFYFHSAIACKYHDDNQACQALMNLCILQLYNEQTLACLMFKNI